MSLKTLICSQCGAPLTIDDSSEFASCRHCGTKTQLVEIVKHVHTGKVEIEGFTTIGSRLASAWQYVDAKNYEKASELFSEILNSDSENHSAWWGKYTCEYYFSAYYEFQDKYGNSGVYTKASILNDNITKYAQFAIKYAPPKDAEKYRNAIQNDIDFIKDVENGKYDKIVKDKKGCYIATAVYGSYSCNKVLALRHYRDEVLDNFLLGRVFVRLYYRFSPFFAQRLKSDSSVTKYIRFRLDKLIKKINSQN